MARGRTIAALNLDAARAEGGEVLVACAACPTRRRVVSRGPRSQRLAVLDELEGLVGPDDLQLRLLRAQALLELGDPRSVVLVQEVSNEAELTGRPAARWLAASRRAAVGPAGRTGGRGRGHRSSRRRRSRYGSATTTRGGSPTSNAGSWPASPAAGPTSCAIVPTVSRRSSAGHRGGRWSSPMPASADEAAKVLDGFRATEAHGPGVNAGYDLWFPSDRRRGGRPVRQRPAARRAVRPARAVRRDAGRVWRVGRVLRTRRRLPRRPGLRSW